MKRTAETLRGWEARYARWVWMINGKRVRVTCEQLELSPDQWTEEGSRTAAWDWLQRHQQQTATTAPTSLDERVQPEFRQLLRSFLALLLDGSETIPPRVIQDLMGDAVQARTVEHLRVLEDAARNLRGLTQPTQPPNFPALVNAANEEDIEDERDTAEFQEKLKSAEDKLDDVIIKHPDLAELWSEFQQKLEKLSNEPSTMAELDQYIAELDIHIEEIEGFAAFGDFFNDAV